MTNKAFDDFVNSQSQREEETKIDWPARLDEWKVQVRNFYKTIANLLKSYIESGKIKVAYGATQIYEEHIGSYEIPTLGIEIGDSKVKFSPVGTLIIGARGRIDMEGPRGIARFVLVPKDSSRPNITIRIGNQTSEAPRPKDDEIEWAWKLSTPPPKISYLELDEDSFFSAVLEVVNG